MTTLRQAAQQALEQLQLTRIYVEKALSRAIDNKALPDTIADVRDDLVYHDEAITALRQALEAEQQDEPVAWQYRMRPDWGSKKDCWGPWQDCTKEQAAMYQRVPLLNDWAYESRQLYTRPQPAQQPLTDEQLLHIYVTTKGFEFYRVFARAIEKAHGIVKE